MNWHFIDNLLPIMPYTNRTQTLLLSCRRNINFCLIRTLNRQKLYFFRFRLRFRRAYDSAYDSDFRFSLGHKRSFDSDFDSVASENQPLAFYTTISLIALNFLHEETLASPTIEQCSSPNDYTIYT